MEHAEPAPFPLAYDPAPYRNRPEPGRHRQRALLDNHPLAKLSRGIQRRTGEVARRESLTDHAGRRFKETAF